MLRNHSSLEISICDDLAMCDAGPVAGPVVRRASSQSNLYFSKLWVNVTFAQKRGESAPPSLNWPPSMQSMRSEKFQDYPIELVCGLTSHPLEPDFDDAEMINEAELILEKLVPISSLQQAISECQKVHAYKEPGPDDDEAGLSEANPISRNPQALTCSKFASSGNKSKAFHLEQGLTPGSGQCQDPRQQGPSC
ncbi:unnamed protein product, partial [Protopolystoma xenopodis]